MNAGFAGESTWLDKYGEALPGRELVSESGEWIHIKILEDNDFLNFKISMKASDVFMTMAAYSQLAEQTEAPFHLGITEAGGFVGGTVKSAIGLGNLLWMGLGDTMRVSLSADPVEEVKIGFEILKSLGLRHRRCQHHLLPVLCAAGVRRDQDGRGAGEAAGAHQDADEPVDHRLRGERAGRGAE